MISSIPPSMAVRLRDEWNNGDGKSIYRLAKDYGLVYNTAWLIAKNRRIRTENERNEEVTLKNGVLPDPHPLGTVVVDPWHPVHSRNGVTLYRCRVADLVVKKKKKEGAE